jgi:hypothetical protein
MVALFVFFPLLTAFLWRIRGGLLNNITGAANWMGFNDTVVRIVWSLGTALGFGLMTRFQWVDIALAVGLFLGTTLIGWFGAALFPTKWVDIGLLSLSGTLRMAPVSFVLLNPWPLLAGVLCGPIYWVGSRIPQTAGGWDFWQEWLFGTAIGASLVASAIYPSPLHWNF